MDCAVPSGVPQTCGASRGAGRFRKMSSLKNGRVCCIRCAADTVFFEAARENRGTVSKRGGEHSMESGGNPPGKEVIQLGITNSNKVINVDRIDCSGSLRVTLALTAAPDIISNPTDIVLVLDRSGSMAGTPLANMKTGRMGRLVPAAVSVLSVLQIPRLPTHS